MFFFLECNVECEVMYLSFKWCPMMPFGFTAFFTFTIRQLFHRISSCFHTLTNHICIRLWAGYNNSVYYSSKYRSQLTWHTTVTRTCRRAYKTCKNCDLFVHTLGNISIASGVQQSQSNMLRWLLQSLGKTCILRTDEKYDAKWHHCLERVKFNCSWPTVPWTSLLVQALI
jgi:hypothetical protein